MTAECWGGDAGAVVRLRVSAAIREVVQDAFRFTAVDWLAR
jgi:hypothetical protein